MENFQFNLQKVLDYRVGMEEKKKVEYVDAQKNLLKQEGMLNKLLDKRFSAENYMSSNMTGYECQALTRYIELLDKKIQGQKAVVNECKKTLEIKTRELTKCMRDRKVMEKLKERAYEEFQKEANRKEQNLNDDFALQAFARMNRR